MKWGFLTNKNFPYSIPTLNSFRLIFKAAQTIYKKNYRWLPESSDPGEEERDSSLRMFSIYKS